MVDDVEKITNQEFLNTEEVKKKISERLLQDWERYRKSMSLMALDAPLSILNLPKSIEKALNSHGIHRVFELSCANFTEIEGLSEIAVDRLTTCFNEFLSIC
jgi:hypothetical protein